MSNALRCRDCKYYQQDFSLAPCSECKNAWSNKKEDMFECESKKEKDNVNSPEHYKAFPLEVIDIIGLILDEEQFKGYCLGNEIKYRLRAGIKDPDKIIEDISKAEKYREWRNGI